MFNTVRLATAAVGATVIGTLGAGIAQAAPTVYLPPTSRFNILLADTPNLTETLAVTPDGQGHLAMSATGSSFEPYSYPLQVFWVNFDTGQIGYVSAPYGTDTIVSTGKGNIGIGNMLGFPASPSLGTVRS